MFLFTDGSVSKGENKIHYLMLAHVKYLPHILLLAGGLALAGCGGSSDPEEEPGATNPGATAPSASGAKTLTLPAGETIGNGSGANIVQTITVASGDTRQIGTSVTSGSASYFTCTGDPCVITIPAGARSLTQLTYTGGELTRSAIGPAAPTSTRTATPTADDNPLSKGSLLATVRAGSATGLFGQAIDTDASDAVTPSRSFTLIDKRTGSIWLQAFQPDDATTPATRDAGDGHGYYGIWTTSVANAVPGSTDATKKRFYEWAGSKPYGKTPDASLAAAAYYNGRALLHVKDGSNPWTQDNTATVHLKANFKGGWIQGLIDRTDTPIIDADFDDDGTNAAVTKALGDITLKASTFS